MENVRYLVAPMTRHFLFEPASSRKKECVLLSVIDLLSQKRSLRILAELEAGEVRFNALARRVGVSSNTLRLRIAEMAQAGIVVRKVVCPMPPSVVISLTAKGRELARIVTQLLEWESRWDGADAESPTNHYLAAEIRTPYRA